MFTDLVLPFLLYGGLGSFVYSLTQLLVCVGVARQPGETVQFCLMKFVVAVPVGTIGALIFGPWIANLKHMTDPRELVALAGFIGMTFNPGLPVILNLAPRLADAVLAALKGKP